MIYTTEICIYKIMINTTSRTVLFPSWDPAGREDVSPGYFDVAEVPASRYRSDSSRSLHSLRYRLYSNQSKQSLGDPRELVDFGDMFHQASEPGIYDRVPASCTTCASSPRSGIQTFCPVLRGSNSITLWCLVIVTLNSVFVLFLSLS